MNQGLKSCRTSYEISISTMGEYLANDQMLYTISDIEEGTRGLSLLAVN